MVCILSPEQEICVAPPAFGLPLQSLHSNEGSSFRCCIPPTLFDGASTENGVLERVARP